MKPVKLVPMSNFVSLREWAVGFYVCALGRMLVVLIGTAWHFGFTRRPAAFGLCLGPFTIGGAK